MSAVMAPVAAVPAVGDRRAATVAAVALGLGVIADTAFTWLPSRLDAVTALGALLLGMFALAEGGVLRLDRDGRLPLVAAGCLLAALLWRDSGALFLCNLLAAVVLGALAVPGRGARLVSAGVGEYVARQALAAVAAIAGAIPLLGAVEWNLLRRGTPLQRAWGAALGAVAALPVLLVFGLLLGEADPIFASALRRLVQLDLTTALSHAAVVGALAWGAGGYLHYVGLKPVPAAPPPVRHARVGLLEVGTALTLIELLFAGFVAVQLRYLFGGASVVEQVAGLSYAEYARRGFFELVWVVTLSLPVLLFAEWVLDRDDPRAVRRFRWLASGLLVLLFLILASALQRMRLYTEAYGLTELRLYTTAFMGWLVLVFGWAAATVLRERRERFAVGAVGAALFVLGAVNLLNPDALIVRTNVARAVQGRPFDAEYTTRLSADAVPAMLEAIARLPQSDRCALAAKMTQRWPRWTPDDAPKASWNLARVRARQLAAPTLRSLGCT